LNQKRRARLAGVHAPGVSAKDWRNIKAYYQGCCVYCGERYFKLSRDHVIPITLGGHDAVYNVVPACKSCNSSKHNKPLNEWFGRPGLPPMQFHAKIVDGICLIDATPISQEQAA